MVGAARVTYPDTLSGGLAGDKLCGNTQATGAARRLCATCTLFTDNRALLSEQQFLRAQGEFRQAIDPEIVFGRFIFQ